jgi:hypothetical protein
MFRTLLILLTFSPLLLFSPSGTTTYYVSSSTGSDSDNGLTPGTAFQTVGHVNTLSLNPGDQVLFFCGDVWQGEMLEITDSGASGSPLTFSSYPAGCADKPVLSGSLPISGWGVGGVNIYVADLDTGGNAGKFPYGINQLFRDGDRLMMGRWPNIGAPNGGYSYMDGQSGSQITDNELPAGNWAGATVHIKGMRWYILNRDVTGSSGTTLTLNTSPDCFTGSCAGWGYFVHNHVLTLDQEGEWAYDPGTNQVFLYSTGGTPTNVEGSVVLTDDDRAWGGITLGGDLQDHIAYVTVENFIVQNWFRNGISSPTNLHNYENHHLIIRENKILWVDRTAISLATWVYDALDGQDGWRGGNHLEIAENMIMGANHMGMDSYAKQSSIHNNSINYVGLIEYLNQAGMGCPTNASGGFCTEDGDGIRLKVDNAADSGHSNTVYKNWLFGIGYNGIDVFGFGNTLTNNVINNACYAKGDCGAVRTFGGDSLSDTPVHDLTIQGNMLINTIGNTDGCHNTYAARFGFGLYIDHYSTDILTTDNTITGSTSHGILYQDSTGQITDNILYNNASGSAYAAQIYLTGTPTFVSSLSGNVMYSLKTTAWTLSAADANRMTNSDGNYFFNPYLPQHIHVSGAKTLTEWQAFSGQDANSVESWFQQPPGDAPLSTIAYNLFDYPIEYDLGGTQYLDLDQNPVVGTLTLPPFTSQILIDNGPAALTLFNISPSLMAVADAADFTLTLTGAGFTENSVVRWNGADRPTTFVSATTLTADIPGTDVDEVGSFSVTVYDPGPTEEETGAVLFWVVEEVWEVWLPVVGR